VKAGLEPGSVRCEPSYSRGRTALSRERVVVEAGQALGAIGVAPQPLDKPALERLGFFLGRERLLLVDDMPAVVELVRDPGQPPVQKLDNDAQRRSARRTPVAEVPGGGDDRLRLEHPLGCLSDLSEAILTVLC